MESENNVTSRCPTSMNPHLISKPAPLTVSRSSRTIRVSGWCCFPIRPTLPRSAPLNLWPLPSAMQTFKALNCELLGLSIDSYYSHVAWIRNIKEKFDVEIPFPIIEDLSMKVARAYGMIHPGAADTSAVRATFIIDPEGVLRAMVYYPMSNGRSIDEFVRLVSALQTSDANGVATPEAWQPGDKVIVPPPADMDAAEARMKEGYECTDWYFCKKSL